MSFNTRVNSGFQRRKSQCRICLSYNISQGNKKPKHKKKLTRYHLQDVRVNSSPLTIKGFFFF